MPDFGRNVGVQLKETASGHVSAQISELTGKLNITVKQGKRAKYETPVVEGACGLSEGTILRATGWRIPIVHRWRQVHGRQIEASGTTEP